MAESAQGSTVSFAGATLGNLLDIDVSGGDADSFESGHSAVTGGGIDSVAWMYQDVLRLTPGTISISFIGASAVPQIGTRGALVVAGVGAASGIAFVKDSRVRGTVGDKIRGTATFQLTGE